MSSTTAVYTPDQNHPHVQLRHESNMNAHGTNRIFFCPSLIQRNAATSNTETVDDVPPSAPLAGIELNPGPTSSPSSGSASTLFNDGLHLIFSLLTDSEWTSAFATCRQWYNIACRSEPCRSITLTQLANNSGRNGPLNRHLVSLTRHQSNEVTLVQMSVQCLSEVMRSFPALRRLEVAIVQEDASSFTSTESKQTDPGFSFPTTSRLTHLLLLEENRVSSAAGSGVALLCPQLSSLAPQLTHLELYSTYLHTMPLAPLSECVALHQLHLGIHPPWINMTEVETVTDRQILIHTLNHLRLLGSPRFAHIEELHYHARLGVMSAMLCDRVMLKKMKRCSLILPAMQSVTRFRPIRSADVHRFMPNLTSIECRHPSEIVHLTQFKYLRSLSLGLDASHRQRVRPFSQFLIAICQLVSLTHLELGHLCTSIRSQYWSHFFASLPHLTSISLSLWHTDLLTMHNLKPDEYALEGASRQAIMQLLENQPMGQAAAAAQANHEGGDTSSESNAHSSSSADIVVDNPILRIRSLKLRCFTLTFQEFDLIRTILPLERLTLIDVRVQDRQGNLPRSQIESFYRQVIPRLSYFSLLDRHDERNCYLYDRDDPKHKTKAFRRLYQKQQEQQQQRQEQQQQQQRQHQQQLRYHEISYLSNHFLTLPAPRLVGIELNPGPPLTSSFTSHSFSNLFTDGIHEIFRYLLTEEWNNAILISKRFYSIAQTREPCRRISFRPSLLSQSQSQLRLAQRHLTKIVQRRVDRTWKQKERRIILTDTSLRRLMIRHCCDEDLFDFSADEMKHRLESADVLPELEFLELAHHVGQVHMYQSSTSMFVTEPPSIHRFLFDQNQKYKTGNYRMNIHIHQPPASPLVGIELNPGPTHISSSLSQSPSSSSSSSSIASTLFTDGLLIIFSYLNPVDLVTSVISISHYWYESVKKERSRSIVLILPSDRLLPVLTSPLRHHVTTFILSLASEGIRSIDINQPMHRRRAFHTMSKLCATLNALPSLTTYSAHFYDDGDDDDEDEFVLSNTTTKEQKQKLMKAIVEQEQEGESCHHQQQSLNLHSLSTSSSSPSRLRTLELLLSKTGSSTAALKRLQHRLLPFINTSLLPSLTSLTLTDFPRVTSLSSLASSSLTRLRINFSDPSSSSISHQTDQYDRLREIAQIPRLEYFHFQFARVHYEFMDRNKIVFPTLTHCDTGTPIDAVHLPQHFFSKILNHIFPSLTQLSTFQFYDSDLSSLGSFTLLTSIHLNEPPTLSPPPMVPSMARQRHRHMHRSLRADEIITSLTSSGSCLQLKHLHLHPTIDPEMTKNSECWNRLFTYLYQLESLSFDAHFGHHHDLTLTLLPHVHRIRALRLNIYEGQLTLENMRHFIELRRLEVYGQPFLNRTVDQVKEYFSHYPFITPHLEYLHLCDHVPLQSTTSIMESTNIEKKLKSKTIRFVYDAKNPHATPNYRTVITTPANRLVGIELNPGPISPLISSDTSKMTRLTSLFNDGIHTILSFLTTREWNRTVSTCVRLYDIAVRTEPTRSIQLIKLMHITNFSALLSSRLKRHCTRLIGDDAEFSYESTSDRLQFDDFRFYHERSPSQLYSTLRLLPSLESLDIRLCEERCYAAAISTRLGPPISHEATAPQIPAHRLNRLSIAVGTHNQMSLLSTLLPHLHSLTPHLTHLTLSVPDLVNLDIASLTSNLLPSLRRLDLYEPRYEHIEPSSSNQVPLAMQQLKFIADKFTHLEEMTYFMRESTFSDCVHNEEWMKLGSLPQVTAINSHWFEVGELPLLHHIMPNLHTLKPLEFVGVDMISTLGRFTQLSTLAIDRIPLDQTRQDRKCDSSVILNALVSCHSLTHLTLGRWTPSSVEEWEHIFSSSPGLISLSVRPFMWREKEKGDSLICLRPFTTRIQRLELQFGLLTLDVFTSFCSLLTSCHSLLLLNVTISDLPPSDGSTTPIPYWQNEDGQREWLHDYFNNREILPACRQLLISGSSGAGSTNFQWNGNQDFHFAWDEKRGVNVDNYRVRSRC